MRRRAPASSWILFMLLKSATVAYSYRDETCCLKAKEQRAFMSLSGEKLERDSDIVCGQIYDDDIPAAPNAYITYGFCTRNCGGWGISDAHQPKQWAVPIVGFLLPAVVFTANIPRRLELVSSRALEGNLLGKKRGYKRALLAFVLTIPALVLAMLDTIAWVVVTIGMAGPMMVSGLQEALLDFKILRLLQRIENECPRLAMKWSAKERKRTFESEDLEPSSKEVGSVKISRRHSNFDFEEYNIQILRNKLQLLMAVLCGNIQLDTPAGDPQELITNALLALSRRHGSGNMDMPIPIHTLEPTLTGLTLNEVDVISPSKSESVREKQLSFPPIRQDPVPGQVQPDPLSSRFKKKVHYLSIAERLKSLMMAQTAFGVSVGAPVVFYLGSFVYSVLELLNDKGDEDAAYSVAFGVEWMIIVHVAIVNGLLLACNNPSAITMLVGLRQASFVNPGPPLSRLRRISECLFPPVHDGLFQPVSMWRRGINKRMWLERSHAWQSYSSFRRDARIGIIEWLGWIVIPTIILITIPPVAGGVVAWRTPPSGWGCRSLSFATYGAVQLILTPLYFLSTNHPRRTAVQRLSWRLCWTIFGVLFVLSTFSGIGTPMMQIMGVYRNCFCSVNSDMWFRLDEALINVASDTQYGRSSSAGWIAMGTTASVFMTVYSFAGWRYQSNIQRLFENVINDVEN